MGNGIGIGFGLSWLLFLLLASCHAQNSVQQLCREEQVTLELYEKCVNETSYMADIKYARKEKDVNNVKK